MANLEPYLQLPAVRVVKNNSQAFSAAAAGNGKLTTLVDFPKR